jgi:cellulase/cellobiase CelA1
LNHKCQRGHSNLILSFRDCAAAASNGEFSIADNGSANYVKYIDALVAQIQSKFISCSVSWQN